MAGGARAGLEIRRIDAEIGRDVFEEEPAPPFGRRPPARKFRGMLSANANAASSGELKNARVCWNRAIKSCSRAVTTRVGWAWWA